MTIYVVAELSGRWDDGDFHEEIESDYGYFTTRDEAQQFVDSVNAPILERQRQLIEGYQAQVKAWTDKNNEARKLGFRNPDNYPINPGPILPALTVVEINPHEVTP